MKNIKKVLAVFIAIVIIAGAVVAIKSDFNYGIKYKGVTELKFMLGQVLDMDEVEGIVKEAFNGKEVRVQGINTFNDSVNISVVNPTDEEIQVLVDKFNERYEQSNELSNITRVDTANVSVAEIVKPYILPSAVALVLVAAYMAFRYRKIGVLKVVVKPVFAVCVVEALFFAVFAIVRIPITIWTVPLALLFMMLTLVHYTNQFEKNLIK